MQKWELLLPSTPFSSLEKKKKKDFPISFTILSSQLTECSPSPCGAAGGADPVLAAQPEDNAGGMCLTSSLYSPSRSSPEEGEWKAEGSPFWHRAQQVQKPAGGWDWDQGAPGGPGWQGGADRGWAPPHGPANFPL